jgi:sodium/bile acid cotransporter 7
VLERARKSPASGVPMAKVLFSGATVGMVMLPLMLFHQIRLVVCAVLAQRFARRLATANIPGRA